MTRRYIGSVALLLVLAVGCRRDAAPAVTATGPAADRLPALQLHHLSTTIENGPRRGFAIGPQGTIVSGDDTGDGMMYSLIDSTGSVVRRIGRRGDGPGEVRGGWTAVFDSTFVVVSQRIVRYAFDGRPLETVSFATDVIPRISVSAHEILGSRGHPGGNSPAVVSMVTGVARDLFAAPDSFIVASFPASNLFENGAGVQSVAMPVLGLWSGGFVVADGWRYRLAIYDWNGSLQRVLSRDVPRPHLSAARLATELSEDLAIRRSLGRAPAPADVERIRDDIASRRQPYFTHVRSLGFDGEGRIWVIGIDADSGFADVFNSQRFLGRVPLPCPSMRAFDSWSLNGTWLVLACAPDDPDSDRDAVFKVFRIVDR